MDTQQTYKHNMYKCKVDSTPLSGKQTNKHLFLSRWPSDVIDFMQTAKPAGMQGFVVFIYFCFFSMRDEYFSALCIWLIFQARSNPIGAQITAG